MKKLIALLLVLSMLVAIGCSDDDDDAENGQATTPSPSTTGPITYQDVSASEAKDLIDATLNLVIIDVSPVYDNGHLPDAVNYPFGNGTLAEVLPRLNKNLPYLVYCHSDSVSIAGAELLIDAGFETVYRLAGNYAAWVDAGFAVETGAGAQTMRQWKPDGIVTEYSNAAQFDGKYELYWATDGTYIYVGMKAETDGWVAVGFDPSSKMDEADIILGFIADGQISIIDSIGTAPINSHPEDIKEGGVDNILEFGGAESDGFTTIEFKRKLVTKDPQDNDLAAGPLKIIWAYGSGDNASQRHSDRGTSEIVLGE